jgi:hypothetical protein
MVDILHRINWLDGVTGALLGASLPVVVTFLVNFIRGSRDIDVAGVWYSFNITDKGGKTQLACYEWKLRRSFLSGTLIARGQSMIDQSIIYHASFSFDKEYLHVHGEGRNHDEHVSLIFKREYPYHEQVMNGVFLGFDYTKSPVTGITILSRHSSLSQTALCNLRNSKMQFHLNSPVRMEVIPFEPDTIVENNILLDRSV